MLVFVVPVTEEQLQLFIFNNKPVDLRSLFVRNCSSGDRDEDLGLQRSERSKGGYNKIHGTKLMAALPWVYDKIHLIDNIRSNGG